MKVWRLGTKPDCMEVSGKNYKESNWLHEEVIRIENYIPVEFEIIKQKKSKKDAVTFYSGTPAIKGRAKELLETFLNDDQVQFCKVICEVELWVMRTTNIIDAMDKELSEYDVFDGDRIGYISKLFFLPDAISEGTYIFKIPQQLTTHIYVTEPFIDFVTKNKITGFDFIEVWDSEHDEEKERVARKPYEDLIKEINSKLDKDLDWETVSPLLKEGRAFISDCYKIQFNSKGEFLLGQLTLDLTYEWMKPIYLPPNILYYHWSEVEPDKL